MLANSAASVSGSRKRFCRQCADKAFAATVDDDFDALRGDRRNGVIGLTTRPSPPSVDEDAFLTQPPILERAEAASAGSGPGRRQDISASFRFTTRQSISLNRGSAARHRPRGRGVHDHERAVRIRRAGGAEIGGLRDLVGRSRALCAADGSSIARRRRRVQVEV